MMHRCSSGSCSCGYYHSTQTNSSFSMLFSMPNNSNTHRPYDETPTHEMYSFASSPPSSSVDCTLSLGTPSTRLTTDPEKPRRSSYMSNFCWDILQSKQSSHKTSSRGNHNNNNNSSAAGGGGDGLLARRCANCDTTSTPLWRNGPKGPKSLCNACGIRFKKEERRASAAAATTGDGNIGGGNGGGMMESQQHMLNSSWVHHHQYSQTAAQKIPYFSSPYGNHEFRFIEDEIDRDSDNGIPFLSWRLNVTDRPGLVHDFTR
ncbi:OLC1v1010853C1 [Oldenlandia corymbosa var. corymbosa]|uniref:OLC1v1010853C1 n=1 Tax=Oldenlandia corymbosa var. corymbosa TaxID=529605 RepID=A0AAV1DVB6_OLDCO|nr:OLC1v1010853C1 [Oldenlandia corymbosa var. corymbosa]